MADTNPHDNDFLEVKALVFDLMGTCTDWKTTITGFIESDKILTKYLSPIERVQLAIDWRQGFFEEIHTRFRAQLPQEDIDITHGRVLDRLLEQKGIDLNIYGERERNSLIRAWHDQKAWPDAIESIARLKTKLMVVVLANGTTRLQLDIIRSSGLAFHTLFSSQLLGFTKPAPEIYYKALSLLDIQPNEAVMVAAHAYDLRAAKAIGMKTAYIHRQTEDLDEDMEAVENEVDLFLTGRRKNNPLEQLADFFS
ncbi:HAD-like domain-containing protein [Xylogone sp. PMI_703]|nr:HAD-like domain-containing protein [Xylogone sp. PMI_703]